MRQFTKQKSVTGADGRLLLNVLFKHIINETATTDASPAAVVLLSPASERMLNHVESPLSLVFVHATMISVCIPFFGRRALTLDRHSLYSTKRAR